MKTIYEVRFYFFLEICMSLDLDIQIMVHQVMTKWVGLESINGRLG